MFVSFCSVLIYFQVSFVMSVVQLFFFPFRCAVHFLMLFICLFYVLFIILLLHVCVPVFSMCCFLVFFTCFVLKMRLHFVFFFNVVFRVFSPTSIYRLQFLAFSIHSMFFLSFWWFFSSRLKWVTTCVVKACFEHILHPSLVVSATCLKSITIISLGGLTDNYYYFYYYQYCSVLPLLCIVIIIIISVIIIDLLLHYYNYYCHRYD